jgi:hypothetical protein
VAVSNDARAISWLPDHAASDKLSPCGMTRHPQVLFGNLHEVFASYLRPQFSQPIEVRSRWRLAQDVNAQLYQRSNHFWVGRPRHAADHKVRPSAVDQFGGRQEGGDAALLGELFGGCRTANRDSNQRQLIGQQPCQAEEELRAPTRADNAEGHWLHRR